MTKNCTSTKIEKIKQIDELLHYPIKTNMKDYSNLKDFFLNLETSVLNDLYEKLWLEENNHLQHYQYILQINDYLNWKDEGIINFLSLQKIKNMDQILKSFGYQFNDNPYCEIYENKKYSNWNKKTEKEKEEKYQCQSSSELGVY